MNVFLKMVIRFVTASPFKTKCYGKKLSKTIVSFFVFSTSFRETISLLLRKMKTSIPRSHLTYFQQKCVIIFVYISRFCILAAYVVTSVIMWIFDRLSWNNTYLYMHLYIQGYSQRMRLQSRLYRMYTVCFRISIILCNLQLVSFVALSLNKPLHSTFI